MKGTVRRSTIFIVSVSLFFWNVCCCMAAVKGRQEQRDAGQGEDIPILTEEQEESLDSSQKLASQMLFEAADWIDSFFDDRRSVVEENTSRATAKLSMGYSRNDDFEIKPRLDLRLKLPRLSERANLFLEAAEDKDFNIERTPLDDRLANNDGENNELTAGLRYFLKETQKYNVSLDGGLSWDYLFTGVRYRSIQEFGRWQGRLTNRLRYYTDDGLENKTAYDLERRLHTNWLFRTTTGAVLSEEEEGVPHSQYFRLFQVLSAYQAISYESGVYLDTEPSYKLTDILFLVRYRQRFFRDWLVLEVSPRLSFPEDHGREADPGIVLQIEAAFGYQADLEGYRKIFH